MAVVSMKALLETGVHFGHRTGRWNPKMKPFIFTERNGIHILDLQQTIVMIDDCYAIIRDIVRDGGNVLFVGTKRQAQDTVAREAARAKQPYVSERWLGGTLTNWQTIRQRINHLEKLEEQRDAGVFDRLKKKERLQLEREIEKLNSRLGGIRSMQRLPDMLFVIDIGTEETAVREANSLKIPIIGVVDTNCDPDPVDYVIPSNDDAIRAIKLLCSKMADAAIEGMTMRKEMDYDAAADMDSYEYEDFDGLDNVEDEQLLGEATLAKLRQNEQAAEAPAEEADVDTDTDTVVEAGDEVTEEVAEEVAE